jgi:hypothetical protein
MEYVLNSLNVVSQVTVPTARGLQDALSHAVGVVAAPLQGLVPDIWQSPGALLDPTLVLAIGLSVFVVGYFVLRRV